MCVWRRSGQQPTWPRKQDPDAQHQQVATALVLFLSSSYPRYEELTLYLSPAVRQSIDVFSQGMERVQPALRRFSEEGHLPPEGSYYDMTYDAVARMFKTTLEHGLSDEEAVQRQSIYGVNDLPREPPPPWYKILLFQFLDFLIIVIIIAGVVSLALGEYIDGAVLLAVVLVNVALGFYQARLLFD